MSSACPLCSLANHTACLAGAAEEWLFRGCLQSLLNFLFADRPHLSLAWSLLITVNLFSLSWSLGYSCVLNKVWLCGKVHGSCGHPLGRLGWVLCHPALHPDLRNPALPSALSLTATASISPLPAVQPQLGPVRAPRGPQACPTSSPGAWPAKRIGTGSHKTTAS